MISYHIAVFDIGKTNKKLILFDSNLEIKIIDKTNIEEFGDSHLKYDNIEAIEVWMISKLKEYSSQFNIKVISISAHGATFTCIDKAGNLAIPELSYTTDPGEDFHDSFYKEFGTKKELQKLTCTPDFNNLLNVAKGIKFAQNLFSDDFEKVDYILNLPQYFTYKLTGNVAADPTYIGCHTYLWDFNRNQWSSIVDKLDIRSKLPEKILDPWSILGSITSDIAESTGLSADTIVTTGVHDSNASLLPHLISSRGSDFVLNSTGTWCVIMHEQEEVEFKEEELGKVVFFNLSALSKPVKTAIFMGGLEFEAYDKILGRQSSELCDFNFDLYQKIVHDKELFILPGISEGTGQFPDSQPRVVEGKSVYNFADIQSQLRIPPFFDNKEIAYAVLNLSLVIQTKISLDRVDMGKGMSIYTEGGFSYNKAYNAVLSSLYPESNVYLTNLNEATAFGACIIGKAAFENKHPNELKDLFEIKNIEVPKQKLEGFDSYIKKFLNII